MKRLQNLHDVECDIERWWNEPNAPEDDPAAVSALAPMAEQQIGRLRADIEELKASLEKSKRWANRLQGERNQLAALLDKRDEQLQALNRKLGRHLPEGSSEGARDSRDRFGVTPVAAALSWLGACMRALFSGRQRPQEPETVPGQSASGPDRDLASSIVERGDDGDRRVVAVLLFGMDRPDIEQLLPFVERDCGSRHMRPLYLIDTDAFEMLRERRSIFEYLPPLDDRERFDSSLNWDLYIQRRLALIRKKWAPIRVIAFGETATRTLALWSASPFEETALPAVLGKPLGSA